METLLQTFLLATGFLLLVKGADWFVGGASGLAARFGIPQIIIGLTVVAMGTSMPEAAVSISAALKGNADITTGNILGSNILNILLILGLSAAITPLSVAKTTIRCEMPFLICITALYFIQGLDRIPKSGNRRSYCIPFFPLLQDSRALLWEATWRLTPPPP